MVRILILLAAAACAACAQQLQPAIAIPYTVATGACPGVWKYNDGASGVYFFRKSDGMEMARVYLPAGDPTMWYVMLGTTIVGYYDSRSDAIVAIDSMFAQIGCGE